MVAGQSRWLALEQSLSPRGEGLGAAGGGGDTGLKGSSLPTPSRAELHTCEVPPLFMHPIHSSYFFLIHRVPREAGISSPLYRCGDQGSEKKLTCPRPDTSQGPQ